MGDGDTCISIVSMSSQVVRSAYKIDTCITLCITYVSTMYYAVGGEEVSKQQIIHVLLAYQQRARLCETVAS